MRFFLVGDLISQNGPASVNRDILELLPENTLFVEKEKYLFRVFELITKINKVDIVIFSGLSKMNIFGFKMAKILGKKSIYLMHGHLETEVKLNRLNLPNGLKTEERVLMYAPLIVCVSKHFMRLMKHRYPQYSNKIHSVSNPINNENITNNFDKEIIREKLTIMSLGGGVPQKNILVLCEAIEYLRMMDGKDYRLIVIGKTGEDTEKIKSYSFVEYIEEVLKKEVSKYYQKTQLYVQNSIFETFGLAPIEALLSGCNVLISSGVGSKEVLNNLEASDVIEDSNDIIEISRKIKHNIKNNNNKRLMNNLDVKNSKDWLNEILEIIDNEKGI